MLYPLLVRTILPVVRCSPTKPTLWQRGGVGLHFVKWRGKGCLTFLFHFENSLPSSKSLLFFPRPSASPCALHRPQLRCLLRRGTRCFHMCGSNDEDRRWISVLQSKWGPSLRTCFLLSHSCLVPAHSCKSVCHAVHVHVLGEGCWTRNSFQ